MNHSSMLEQLQRAFDQIINQPLTKTTRNELVQYFHFGHTTYTTPQGLILDVGAFTLALNCPWQLILSDGEIIKHNEVFMRKREAGLPAPNWDWKIPGANLRDQRLKDFINAAISLLTKKIDFTENSGLIIHFSDLSRLIVSPDITKKEAEYWQFFSTQTRKFKIGAGPEGII